MKTVDTCAAEFEANTPYHYSTYEDDDEVAPSGRPKIIIIGSGPNRIGQGVEFDYCCVQASFALHDAGYETVMVNCNPETVSTDYDTSDRLYFEPVTWEDVNNVIDVESRTGIVVGVIVSLGGQTPLKLAGALPPELVLGTSPESIDLAEDRERWNALCGRLEIPQPAGGTATSFEEARAIVARVGYPALVRPSYVLGGRAMEIVYSEDDLRRAMAELAGYGSLGREGGLSAERPVLVDRFLEDAIEVDVDAVRDETGEVVIGAVMEHVEEAGVHSGDSACVIPPPTLDPATVRVIEHYTGEIAAALEVIGPLNVQFAVKQLGGPAGGGTQVFVIEANPRASRTVPFVSKATGVPLAKVAARVMAGASLAELRREGLLVPPVTGGHVSVKEAVLPFSRFPDADTLLGPEMRSTGEVMGIDSRFGLAFAKSQAAAGDELAGRRDGLLLPRRPRQGRRGGRRPAVRATGLPCWRPPPGRPPISKPKECRWTPGWPKSAPPRADGGEAGRAAASDPTAATAPSGSTGGEGPPEERGWGRRGGADPRRKSRPGGQHPPRPGTARRRGVYPAGGQPAPGGLPHHGRGRSSRGGGDRRPGGQPPGGAQPAGVSRVGPVAPYVTGIT